RWSAMSSSSDFQELVDFFEKNPQAWELIRDPDKRGLFEFLCSDIDRIKFLAANPWIDLEKILKIADSVMEVSPEISIPDLLHILCQDTAELINAAGATCRTYDPIKDCMIAAASYNWDIDRTEVIPNDDSVAGWVMKHKTHYCVPDISSEPLYKEKEKTLSRGINSMLALPIRLVDYEGGKQQEVLIGTLQLYFEEKNKHFYPEQIKLIKSVVSRFSYVLAQRRKLAIQKRSQIIHESRKALVAIMKRTQSLDQVLNFLVAKIAETLEVRRCSLFSIERDAAGKNVAMLIAGYPLEPFAHRYGITLPFDEHPAFAQVFESGEPLRIDDACNDPRMAATYGLYRSQRINTVFFVPLKDENDVVTNVLVLDGDESRPLTKEDLFFSQTLIQDIELCIQASIRSQERHDFYNQMLAFGAIAKIYAKRLASPETTAEELAMLYKKLYRSMLAVNDIISDRVPFAQKEVFDLNEVIAERLEAYYFPPQVVVEHNIEGWELIITADRKKVGRIIGNLIDNAHRKLEELRRGFLKVIVQVEHPYAVIEISNSGSIPRHIRDDFCSHTKPVSGRPGSGQGLDIVKLFTLMHNGIVELESPEDADWTLFRVKLPL
ncbi:MAG: GAF domain-containing protein, partial [Desulfobacterota bacterium]|nr:GAF domain-containing protein [Thermodesulfobacteriota bacterium]